LESKKKIVRTLGKCKKKWKLTTTFRKAIFEFGWVCFENKKEKI
jgi:hypothetical protein